MNNMSTHGWYICSFSKLYFSSLVYWFIFEDPPDLALVTVVQQTKLLIKSFIKDGRAYSQLEWGARRPCI